MTSIPAGIGTVLAAVLALPATATAAPALTPLRPCYDAVSKSATEPVEIAASGFTPGAAVDVAVDGRVQYPNVPVAADGTVNGSIRAPYVAKGQRSFTVTITQQGAPDLTVTADALVTRLTVTVTPRSSRPTARVRFRGSGFTDLAEPIYLHYVHKGKVRRTVKLVAKPDDPCGGFDVRRRQFPFKPALGHWTLQVDQLRAYDATPATAYLRFGVDVKRVLRRD